MRRRPDAVLAHKTVLYRVPSDGAGIEGLVQFYHRIWRTRDELLGQASLLIASLLCPVFISSGARQNKTARNRARRVVIVMMCLTQEFKSLTARRYWWIE